MCERELETEQNCNILTPTLLAIIAFLSRSPGLLNRGPGCPASLGHVPQSSILSPTGLISKLIWSPTDWISCALSYIIVQRPSPCCGRHKSHSFNLSTVKVIISWYSSTGPNCYLHRCISYFDSLPGSEVNMQQAEEPSLPYYLPIAGGRIIGFIPFPKGISAMGNAISLVQDLNSFRRVHFLRR